MGTVFKSGLFQKTNKFSWIPAVLKKRDHISNQNTARSLLMATKAQQQTTNIHQISGVCWPYFDFRKPNMNSNLCTNFLVFSCINHVCCTISLPQKKNNSKKSFSPFSPVLPWQSMMSVCELHTPRFTFLFWPILWHTQTLMSAICWFSPLSKVSSRHPQQHAFGAKKVLLTP